MAGNADRPFVAPGQDPGTEARRERRLVYRMVREWLSVRRLRRLPSIDDLNPRAFSINWYWGILAHLGDGPRYTAAGASFEFVGNGFLDEVPSCNAATKISAIPDGTRLACAIAPLRCLVEIGGREPVVAEGAMRQPEQAILKFRTVALPFADHAGTARYALGCFSGAVFAVSPADQLSESAGKIAFERYDTTSGRWIRA